jgi:hypothetical protein
MKRNLMPALLWLAALSALSIKVQAAPGPQSGEGRVLRAGRLLTNDSILRLVKAGVSDDTILHMVSTQPGKYSLGVDDVIRLKQAGVSDDVLDGMLSQSIRGSSPAPSVPAQVFVTPPATGNSTGQQPSQPSGPSNQRSNPQASAQAKSARQTTATGSNTSQEPQGGAYHNSGAGKKIPQKPQP